MAETKEGRMVPEDDPLCDEAPTGSPPRPAEPRDRTRPGLPSAELKPGGVYSEEEETVIIQRLRNLGYL